MTQPDWQQVKELLDEALERDFADRGRFLEESCGDDEGLKREVESLLAFETHAVALDRPAFTLHGEGSDGDGGEDDLAGELLGGYRLLREIGRGGMGRVYLAEAVEDQLEHRVAVKVLKRGIDTDDVVARFKQERQILANLEHENIARFYSGATTPAGLPYFVTEYIRGAPIDQYCARDDCSLQDTIRLFRKVCRAVQFAHSQPVVHRDLKASNILVTDDGVPKLLDFGIAKALRPETNDALATRASLRFLTPEVASPEQVQGAPVTVASDVYSLGVLLFRLVTGESPYRSEDRSRNALERAVLEEDPPRPSSLVPKPLRREVRGDLDNIILKALRKEPDRRYRSVEALEEDLARYQQGKPVRATGDSPAYVLRKTILRHKLASFFVAFAVLGVLGYAVHVSRLRDQAERQRERAERVTELLIDTFSLPAPERARGETLTVHEALDAGREHVLAGLDDQPELRAALMDPMGRVYTALGLYDEALPLLETALDLRTATLGPGDLLLAESHHSLSTVLRELGRHAEAAEHLRRALDIQRRHRERDHPEYLKGLNNLATHLQDEGEYGEAETLHREILELKEQRFGADDPEVAVTLHNLANVLLMRGELDEAERRFRRALEIRRRAHGDTSPRVARTLNGLAAVLEARGELDAAGEHYRRALEVRRTLHPDGHPDLAVSLNNLGLLRQRQGELESSEGLLREAAVMFERFLPEGHVQRGIVLRNLATVLDDRGADGDALPRAREAHEILRAALGPEHWRAADAAGVLGGILLDLGKLDEAAPLIRRGAERLRTLDDPQYATYRDRALARLAQLETVPVG